MSGGRTQGVSAGMELSAGRLWLGGEGEAYSFLESEEEVHNMDCGRGSSFECVVDYSGNDYFAVDFVDVEEAFVGASDFSKVGVVFRHECESMVLVECVVDVF